MPRVRNRSATGKMCCWSEKHQVFGVAPPRLATSFWVDMPAKARRVFGGVNTCRWSKDLLMEPWEDCFLASADYVRSLSGCCVCYCLPGFPKASTSELDSKEGPMFKHPLARHLRVCAVAQLWKVRYPPRQLPLLQAQSFPKEREEHLQGQAKGKLRVK